MTKSKVVFYRVSLVFLMVGMAGCAVHSPSLEIPDHKVWMLEGHDSQPEDSDSDEAMWSAIRQEPLRVVVGPSDEKLFLLQAIAGEGLMVVTDQAFQSTVSKIRVGSAPISMAISADGQEAFVANHLSDTVSVIDLKTNKVIKTISVGHNPIRVALTPSGEQLYVSPHRNTTQSFFGL